MLSIYIIKLQQSHWSSCQWWFSGHQSRSTGSKSQLLHQPRSLSLWTAQENDGEIMSVSTSALSSQYLSLTLPLVTAPGFPACLLPWSPARQGAGRGGCFLTATSQVGSLQRWEGSTVAAWLPASLPLQLLLPLCCTHTRCSTAACFLGVLEQETGLNNYPFCLSCGHIQWLLVATLLENKIMCMLCSTTARTGPREDEISLFTVLRFPPSSSSRLMSRMVWPRSTSILCVCFSALEFLMFHLAFLMLVDHWADALLKLSPLAPKSHI